MRKANGLYCTKTAKPTPPLGLPNKVELGLAAGEVDNVFAVKVSTLLEFHLHPLVPPLRNGLFDIAFNSVGGIRVQRPVALNGGFALVVPHAYRWPWSVAIK